MEPAAKQETEAVTAWGKEVGGLQLGLVLVPADITAYRLGETIQFKVRVKNVSKGAITISYGLPESSPKITDAKGKNVHVTMPPFLGIYVVPTEKTLRPGETADLYQRPVSVQEVLNGPAEQKGHVSAPTIRVGTGKYKITLRNRIARSDALDGRCRIRGEGRGR